MEWGASLPTLYEMMEQTGIVPKAISSQPKLSVYQQTLYDAFLELSASRAYSMSGPLPISLPVFQSYCWLHQVDAEEAEELWSLMRRLDAHWRDRVEAKKPAPTKSKK